MNELSTLIPWSTLRRLSSGQPPAICHG